MLSLPHSLTFPPPPPPIYPLHPLYGEGGGPGLVVPYHLHGSPPIPHRHWNQRLQSLCAGTVITCLYLSRFVRFLGRQTDRQRRARWWWSGFMSVFTFMVTPPAGCTCWFCCCFVLVFMGRGRLVVLSPPDWHVLSIGVGPGRGVGWS